jgi:hypothetical protein
LSRSARRRWLFARLRRRLAHAADPGLTRRARTRAARHAAALAERLGLLERPARCAWCWRRVRLTRHHWDYDEPLLITYLCAECHTLADVMTREGWTG